MFNIDFIKNKKYFFAFSIAITLIGLIAFFVNGVQYDIDFKSGSIINVDIYSNYNISEVSNLVKKEINETPIIQTGGANSKQLIISTTVISPEQTSKIVNSLKANYKIVGEPTIRNVQPAFGKELQSSAIISVIVASLLIFFYIWFKFRTMGFTSGLTAVLALIHDLLIVLTIYMIFKIPLNSIFVAAILTILGYSINDTVIIYDRIRENKRNLPKESIEKVVNISINQMLTRSIYTVLTVLFMVISLYIFATIKNQQVLKDFTFPLIFGLISGAYSSVCIAAPLWVIMNKKINK